MAQFVLMLQVVFFLLAVLPVLAGIRILANGKIALSKSRIVEGVAARALGLVVLSLGGGIAMFALAIPAMLR
jgi:hypothetical protein